MDRLSDLPEHILQKILCFLSQHEAARTSILSKKWRDLWITRPKVAFSYASFKGTNQEFISTVNNTLKRYHHQTLSLDEFHLSLSDDESFRLLEEWIPRLTQMGVKDFYLSIASKQEYRPLPWVVFDAGSCLQELRVSRYKLNRTAKKIIALKNIKRLHLDGVRIEGDEILHNIISSCPSIETLELYHCEGLSRVKLDNNLSNLKYFTDHGIFNLGQDKRCNIEIRESPSLKSIIIKRNMIWFQPQVFRNLNHLSLFHVGFSEPDQLSSCKFPCLKYMALYYCHGFEELHLSVDAPKIVRFVYAGEFIPSISFAPTSSEWNSVVRVRVYWVQHSNEVPLWLHKLSELLISLSQSTISLRIYQCYSRNNDQHFEENGLVVQQPVEVERLQLICYYLSSFPCLLNALFQICRPKNLVNYFDGEKEIPLLLYKILMKRESRSDCDWVRDLEDVRMEILEVNGGKWDEVNVSEYLNSKAKTGDNLCRQVRFRLKWRQA